MGRTAVRLAGIGLLLVPLLPLRALFGAIPGTTFLVSPGEWLLGLAACAAAWLLTRLHPDGWSGLRAPRHRVSIALGLVVLAAGLLLASVLIFGGRPMIVDGVAHLFQAKLFTSGHASAPAPLEAGCHGSRWKTTCPGQ